MRVQIINDAGEVIWERGRGKIITSRAYANDGTLDEIVAVLKDALKQAEGQLISFQEVDTVVNVRPAAR
ncbi:MAG TPA: hypothetical protein VHU19_13585 [Pyrinomonadaceae bacterium]|jgi:hypothetical protein|nr:hypothetical protein [Pyrinomonadaceae bacterium]